MNEINWELLGVLLPFAPFIAFYLFLIISLGVAVFLAWLDS